MELQQLRYFVVAAEKEHITNAAQILHVTQPSLSQTIHRLETDIGVRLFDHDGKRIRLNEAGREMLKVVGPMLEVLDDMPRRLRDISDAVSRTVSLNILTASNLSTDIILEYKDIAPHINFQTSRSSDSANWDIRISAIFSSDHSLIPENSELLTCEKILLAVPERFDIYKKDEIYLRETAGLPFIKYCGSEPYSTMFTNLFYSSGTRPYISFESDSLSSVIKLITSGMGLGLWPTAIWGSLHAEHVKLINILDPGSDRIIFIQKNPTRKANRSVNDFYDFFIRSFQHKVTADI